MGNSAHSHVNGSIEVANVETLDIFGTHLSLKSSSGLSPCLTDLSEVSKQSSFLDKTKGRDGPAPSLELSLRCASSSHRGEDDSASVAYVVSSVRNTNCQGVTFADADLDCYLYLGNKSIPAVNTLSGTKEVQRPGLDLSLNLSTGPPESVISSMSLGSSQLRRIPDIAVSSNNSVVPLVDERTTSNRWNAAHLEPTLGATYVVAMQSSKHIAAPTDVMSVLPATVSNVTTLKPQKNKLRICQVTGCGKGARGASGRCISHGGGKRCQRSGCLKGAEGRTAFCKAHGGGRRCKHLDCTKSAEGRTDFCIAHGGGRRCSHEGCNHASRGRSGLCIRHGGGKRCQKENCTKSAEGASGLCISHGGGRRCQKPGCTKGAQGSTIFCKGHGGGKRCIALGCTKGAEGSTQLCKGHGGGKRCSYEGGGVCPKSVHGGTLFCVRHGGGKRCATPGCTKSARGRTNNCVRHGGGKRCKHEGCTKSAQGSTDFCKAHGGGPRCSWVELSSALSNQASTPCEKFAGGKSGLCSFHGTQVKDKRVHGGNLLGPYILDMESSPSKKMRESVPSGSNCTNQRETKIDSGYGLYVGADHYSGYDIQKTLNLTAEDNNLVKNTDASQISVPEGRVHGGNLMALLKGNKNLNSC